MTIGMETANEEFMRKIIFLSLITPLAGVFSIVAPTLDLFRGKKTLASGLLLIREILQTL